MFFALPYEQTPCGLYSVGHLVLFLLTAAGVAAGLVLSRKCDGKAIRLQIRVVTAALWILEIAKIVFVLAVTRSTNPNDFVPLYYCSLVLYAGILSSLPEGFWRRVGDIFLATGGLVGGVAFLFCPNTSLPRYPALHFISLHSFLLHGLMVYVGLLLLVRGVYRARFGDLVPCSALVSVMCLCAYLFNRIYDATHPGMRVNLMFISENFPGTPVEWVYRATGPFFPFAMWALQAFFPFLFVFLILKVIAHFRHTEKVDIF